MHKKRDWPTCAFEPTGWNLFLVQLCWLGKGLLGGGTPGQGSGCPQSGSIPPPPPLPLPTKFVSAQNYIQMLQRWRLTTHKLIKWEIFSVLPIAFPLLMWRFQLTWCLMSYILPWMTEMSQEAGAALHMLGALHWSYNAQKLFCRYILPRKFGVHFFDKIYHLGAWRFEMVENGSCLTGKWCKRVEIEPNARIGQLV